MERVEKLVYWTTRAVKDLEKTTYFNANLFGFQKAIEIALEIRKCTDILKDSNFKDIGAIDEDFNHLKYSYRKLIYHHCKITYREGKSKIYIVRVFDTRQNPNKNK